MSSVLYCQNKTQGVGHIDFQTQDFKGNIFQTFSICLHDFILKYTVSKQEKIVLSVDGREPHWSSSHIPFKNANVQTSTPENFLYQLDSILQVLITLLCNQSELHFDFKQNKLQTALYDIICIFFFLNSDNLLQTI